MNEQQITTEIIKSINQLPNSWAWKCPDPGRRDLQRFIPARAFDVIVCKDGKFTAIEVKWINGPRSFNKSRMTEFEDRSLMAVEKAGGCAYLLLGYWFRTTEFQRDKYDLPSLVKRIYYRRYHRVSRLFREYDNLIPYTVITSGFHRLDYKKGWDMSFLDNRTPSNLKWEPFIVRPK